MGYSTRFKGEVTIEPPLNPEEIQYLKDLASTRRMHRTLGPYFTDLDGEYAGQSRREDVIDQNDPDPSQPGLWLQWVPTDDGTALKWDGGEKFYDSEEWMRYLIDTFLKPGASLQGELLDRKTGWIYPSAFEHFAFDHVLNGVIRAQGEDVEDRWDLVVENNVVTVKLYIMTVVDDD